MLAKKIKKMANNIFLTAIIFSALLSPPFILVFADDKDPVPSDKSQVNSWFEKNIQPLKSRAGTLDPALETAESTPKTITVKQDGSGDFKTITDAVKSIPSGNTQRVIISIGPGKYTEKVTVDSSKPFVTFYGDPNNKPVIVYDGTAAKFGGTLYSSTVMVFSDYFSAVNIIFANSAPRPAMGAKDEQAVAMRITGDKASFYNCRFLGFQDTVCDDAGRHFMKDCYIEGTVDFVFGNGKTTYLNVELHVIPGDVVAIIAAQARHTDAEDTGYAFLHGGVTGTGGTGLLGRGWMAYSRVVFAYTDLSEAVNPKGWGDHPETANVFFGEYNCVGAGSKMDGRSGFVKKLGDAEAKPFLSLGFIEASKWLLPPISI